MGIKVITNNVPRDLIAAAQLTESERSEFDYLNWKAIDSGEDSASFFRYRGSLYDLSQFTATPSKSANPEFIGWAGYMSDSYFSGLLIRWPDTEYETVVVARFYESDEVTKS